MSGAPKVWSMNVADSEARPVLGPAGNKTGVLAQRKLASKPSRKVDRPKEVLPESEEKKKASPPPAVIASSSPLDSIHSRSFPSALRRQEPLLHSNLSLNASCSSDASSTSAQSRASTGRIVQTSAVRRKRQSTCKPENAVSDSLPSQETLQGKKRCAWVTANTDPCYAAFHDEEWGVPVHDDRKLFELLVLSGALGEITWPNILNKRHIFREVFADFEPASVAKLNEKKIVAPGSTASSLLSELKLRAAIENAQQMAKIIDEFGSFDKYCWSFVNHKPIVSSFRYPRQVPVKTPKADVISKDLVRRGFRCVSPTVIYSFMQAAGITNDHLISCCRFKECIDASGRNLESMSKAKMEEKKEADVMCMELASAVDGLSISQ